MLERRRALRYEHVGVQEDSARAANHWAVYGARNGYAQLTQACKAMGLPKKTLKRLTV